MVGCSWTLAIVTFSFYCLILTFDHGTEKTFKYPV